MYDEHNVMDMLLLNFDENMLSDEYSISTDEGFKHSHESGKVTLKINFFVDLCIMFWILVQDHSQVKCTFQLKRL